MNFYHRVKIIKQDNFFGKHVHRSNANGLVKTVIFRNFIFKFLIIFRTSPQEGFIQGNILQGNLTFLQFQILYLLKHC